MNSTRFPSPRVVACWLIIALTTSTARAAPPDLDFALVQLRSNGALPFTKTLIDHDPALAKKAATDLERVIGLDSGDLLDHEILTRTPITSRLTRIVVALHFEEGPCFMSIDAYQSTQRQLYLRPRFSREITDLLPEEFIHGSRSN